MPDATKTPERTTHDTAALWRMGAWGASAVFAVAASVWVSVSPPGVERLQTAMQAPTKPMQQQNFAVAKIEPRPEVLRPYDTEAETKRLTQLVQILAADRDRLATRLVAIERTMEDVTGSVRRNAERVDKVERTAATPPPVISAPQTIAATASPPAPANDNTPAAPSTPPTRAAAAPATEVTGAVPPASAGPAEFGIDLGAASTIEGLRALWQHTKQSRAPLLDTLQPTAALRMTKNGAPQLRLVAGPFPSAQAASNVCAAFAAGQGHCKATPFDGQKLSAK